MSPSETIWEKPMLRPRAQSMIAVIRAPDWDDKRQVAGEWRLVREAGVEADAGQHQAEAVGAPDAQQMRARRLEHRAPRARRECPP